MSESIIITIIVTSGSLGVAVLPVYITNRRKTHEVKEKAEEIDKKIGEPNGHGSLTNITEKILGLVEDMSVRMNRMERRLDRLERIVEESDG